MFQYYRYKYYFNAGHSFHNERENAHTHTFTVGLYIGGVEKGRDIPFFEIDAIAKAYFTNFKGVYLNDMPEFAGKEPNIENMGDVFYEALRERLEEAGLSLYQLDISENPLCVYQISDRILLPTSSMDESGRNFKQILGRKKQLTALKRGDEET